MTDVAVAPDPWLGHRWPVLLDAAHGRQRRRSAGSARFQTTFLVQHWLGNEGMPRRYTDYQPQDGFTLLNAVSTVGAFMLGTSLLPLACNVWKSYHFGPQVTVDDQWGHGMSLEWATSCPPPLRNVDRMPRIRSERPAFDLHFPDTPPATPCSTRPPAAHKPLTDEAHGGATYQDH